jgi:hypothetical protein
MLSADPEKRPQSAAALCETLERLGKEPLLTPGAPPPRRRSLALGLVTGMSVLVLGIGGAAVAKTPVGEKATVSLKAAYDKVVKLRADALAHRAPPAPAKRESVAVGSEPAPVAEPAAPPAPLEVAAAAAPSETDDDGEVDADAAPAAVAEAPSAGPDLTQDQEVEVKGAAVESDAAASANPALAKADELWEKGAKIRALGVLRRAARKSPSDAAVHQALAGRAEETGAWGEAVKAARRWAELEKSSEARLSLARLERATGHKERALALIEGVIKDDPASPDAKTLLGEMRGQKLALSQ